MREQIAIYAALFAVLLFALACGGQQPDEEITNSIGMKLRLIPAGDFMMGTSENHKFRPFHKVQITKSFYIGVYEVTQEQYEVVMRGNPSHFKGADRPVENVSWEDAVSFCKRLSKKTGKHYRLPTEAEWEYACRAGSTTTYYWGDRIDDKYVWYVENSDDKTHPVGEKRPNAWGLYDMSGNVYEWCSDWYSENYYRNSPASDPKGAESGEFRVMCSSGYGSFDAQSSGGGAGKPTARSDAVGFRVVREVE